MSKAMTAQKLEELANAKDAKQSLRLEYNVKKADILQQVQAELDALDAEFEPLFDSVDSHVEALEHEVREAILRQGASMRGSRIQAVFMRGRISWDNKGLEGYALAHPEILTFRKEAAPSVQLRVVKNLQETSEAQAADSGEEPPFANYTGR